MIVVVAVVVGGFVSTALLGLILRRNEQTDWLGITVSMGGIAVAASVAVYGANQSTTNAREAIRAAAEENSRSISAAASQSVAEKKLTAYVDFLEATRSAISDISTLTREYIVDAEGALAPAKDLGSRPPERVLSPLTRAAQAQAASYWKLNAYDEDEPAHRTAWRLYAHVGALASITAQWDDEVVNSASRSASIGMTAVRYAQVAHASALYEIERRILTVPDCLIDATSECEASLPQSRQASLYTGESVPEPDPARSPQAVVTALEAEIREVAGVAAPGPITRPR